MSLQQVTITVTGAIVCGVGGPNMQAGDSVRMNLSKVDYPTLPDYISGVVQQPVSQVNVVDPANCIVAGTAYIIEYETDDLNGIIPTISACDVLDLDCVTCCDVLHDRIDPIEVIVGANTVAAAAAQTTADGAVTDAAAAQTTADGAVTDAATAQAAATAAQVTADSKGLSVITSSTDTDAVLTLTHNDGKGNTDDWFSVPQTKLLLTDGTIINDFLEVSIPDGSGGRLVKFIPIQDTSV